MSRIDTFTITITAYSFLDPPSACDDDNRQLYISAPKALTLATFHMATTTENVKVPGETSSESDLTMRKSNSELSLANNDNTLVEDANPLKHDMIALEDWSQTGRGSHVEFRNDESVPLEQGERALTSGSHQLTTFMQVSSSGEVPWETYMKLLFKVTS
jgi:hypothetical protein